MHNTQREPFSGILFFLFQIMCILGITPGGPPTLKWIVFAALVWISHFLITKTTTQDLTADLSLGTSILIQLCTVFDMIFVTHPDTLQNFQDSGGGKVTERPFKQRVVWAYNLYTNPRGIGWAHESRHLPSRPSPSTPRWKFVGVRILHAFLYFILDRVAHALNASNPGMTTPGVLLSQSALHWRALAVVSFGATAFTRMNLSHCLLSAGVVALGLSTPERWPHLFGSPLQAWSVQQFWRKVWHQMLRRIVIACASFATSKIIRSHTRTYGRRAYLPNFVHTSLWVFMVFVIGGIIHVGGEYMLLGRFGSGALKFFILQPVAITLEKMVTFSWSFFNPPLDINGSNPRTKQPNGQNSMKNLSPNTSKNSELSRSGLEMEVASELPMWLRYVGYIWVFLWFVFSYPFSIDPLVSRGIFTDPRVDLRTFAWAS